MSAQSSPFPSRARLLVLYDAQCPLCVRSCAWLEARDRQGALTCVPLQEGDVLERLAVPRDEALRSIQVVARDGQRRSGADGILWALAQLPGYRWLAWLLALPGLRHLARLGYTAVSRSRHRTP